MFADYLSAALKRARYEMLEDGTFYGEIPLLPGVYANAPTLETCREELSGVLEGWVLLGVSLGHEIPEIDGRQILVKKSA